MSLTDALALIAALVTWAEMSRLKWSFLAVGAVLEGLGIFILVFPDLVPNFRRFSLWLGNHTRSLLAHIHRMLKRPRHIVLTADTGKLGLSGERASLMKAPGETATLEDKIEYLLARIIREQ
jgi:hypothetical protein